MPENKDDTLESVVEGKKPGPNDHGFFAPPPLPKPPPPAATPTFMSAMRKAAKAGIKKIRIEIDVAAANSPAEMRVQDPITFLAQVGEGYMGAHHADLITGLDVVTDQALAHPPAPSVKDDGAHR